MVCSTLNLLAKGSLLEQDTQERELKIIKIPWLLKGTAGNVNKEQGYVQLPA